jgi:response regulator RpfG family c-di-GMP phosphodiesterase
MTSEEIEKFYQSYAESIKSIPGIENALHAETLTETTWIKLLGEKADLFRTLYDENEKLLRAYVYPVLKDKSLLSRKTAETYLKQNAALIPSAHTMDMLLEDDLNKTLLAYLKENGGSQEDILIALRQLQSATGHYLTGEKSEEASLYGEQASKFIDIFRQKPEGFADYPKARLLVIQSIFNSFFFGVDFPHQEGKHDILGIEEKLDVFLKRMDTVRPFLSEAEKAPFEIRYENAYITASDEVFVAEKRLTWDKDFPPLSKEEKDAEKRIIDKVYSYLVGFIGSKDKKEVLNEYCHLLYCRLYLKKIDCESYLKELEEIYELRKPSEDNQLYISLQFMFQIVVSSDLASALRQSQKTDQKKADRIIMDSFKEALSYLESIPQTAYNQELMRVTVDYLIDFLPSLKDDGTLVDSLTKLMFFLQTSTCLHNTMVEKISYEIAKAMIEKNPSYFILKGQYENAETVLRCKEEILSYVAQAGLLHDTGKTLFWDIVNLQRRNITKDELAAIRTHSEIGCLILSACPDLRKYAPTALFHHRWYDGKGGYPLEADNVHSPYRNYTDIVTVADSIDAGTDSLGRTYNETKTFKTLLTELNKEAGTRYSPAVVKVLNEDAELQQRLADLTDHGRQAVYKEVHDKYLGSK